MTYPQVGNEVDNLGTTQMEADYREHQHDWRCIARSIIEGLLLASMFLVIIFFCAALQ